MRPLVASLASASALLLMAASASAQGTPGPAGEQLPDLEQELPSALVLSSGALDGHPRRYLLGFRSAVRNVGLGPLVISGRRGSRRTPLMTATQHIQRTDGAVDDVAGVGRLRYVVSPTHRHWHLLGFDRYTLRRADGGKTVRRDRKTGFCLGDRFRTPAPLAGTSPATPAFTSNCGPRQPGRLSVTEGISVGYGDDYSANLEGQYLKLSGLPAGRYVLAHEVNGNHRLRELSYGNNAASLLLSLRWRGGMPYVRVLASCEHSATCTAGAATARRATAIPVAAASRATAIPAASAEARPLYCPLAAAPRAAG